MFIKYLTRIFYFLYKAYHQWCAFLNKKRSIRQMQQLDDCLLDDIGFRRNEQGVIVPATTKRITEQNKLHLEQRRKTRFRYAYLIRRRRRELRRRLSG